MNNITGKYTLSLFFLVFVFSCAHIFTDEKDYEEIPPMLSVLTNVSQSAIEQEFGDKNEKTVINYIVQKKPLIVEWFIDRGYKIRVFNVASHAVVMICDNNHALFEDTYCNGGFPDKDHRGKKIECNITMKEEDIKEICK